MDLLKVDPCAYAVFRWRAVRRSSVVVGAVDVNKRWSGCKRAVSLGKIRLCRGTRSSDAQTLETRATQVLLSKGPVAAGPFYDSPRYPLLLMFPPDRVEVPGNAGHIHREAQDFKKQVHRLHPNQRSERCPQADSAAVKILPHRPRWETSCPLVWNGIDLTDNQAPSSL